jgi:hypothetical protein
MKKIKVSHLLFGLTLLAVLILAAVPAPAYALSASGGQPAQIASHFTAPALAPDSILVCKTVIEWHNGHRVAIRRCHRVTKP